MATWDQFLARLGTQINVFGTQCVAVANFYHRDVLGLPLPGGIASAHQWWNTYSSQPNIYNYYDRIPRSSGQAQVGDIVVEYPDRSNFHHGHICVVVRGWNGVNYETYDQNVNGVERVFRLTKSGREAYGFLRPKPGVSKAYPGPLEEVLTAEQNKMLNEIYDAIRSGSSSVQSRLNAIKAASQSILNTVSEIIVRNGQTYTQKNDRAMTQDFLYQVIDLLNEIDDGFTAVGYDNIAEPAQINYYESEADPGEGSIQASVREQLDNTKLIK